MITKQIIKRGEEDKNSDFACLVHDLKTPVSAQARIIDLFLSGSFGTITTAQREVLAELRNSCGYMKNLVQDILFLYSFENRQIALKKEVFDFRELINDIMTELSVLGREKEQILSLITETQNSYFTGDKHQIRRCVVNLISNAIAYAPENSEIIIKFDKTQNELIFSTTNKASYLLPEDLERCFKKFKSCFGSGLGLYIVKQIISAHRGTVFAKKNKNNSCSLGFILPIP
ncbi:HAMP domain-containing histidine kinase [bacterium]|nr:HAMP domain-containing histidine kinase [bacterium]